MASRQGPPARTTGHSRRSLALRCGAVVVASLLLGGLTSYAQGVLPGPLAPLANSASGWTLLTALLVYAARLSLPWSAAAGAASFVCLVLGYAVASDLRGLFYSPVLFGVVGVVVGPFVGAAAGWLHARDRRLHVAVALLGGIGLGEAAYGLTVVRETTGWSYWTAVGVVSLVLLAWSVRRRASGRAAVLGVLGAVVVAAAFGVAYPLLGTVLG